MGRTQHAPWEVSNGSVSLHVWVRVLSVEGCQLTSNLRMVCCLGSVITERAKAGGMKVITVPDP